MTEGVFHGVLQQAAIIGIDDESRTLANGAFRLISLTKPAAGGNVGTIADIDDVLDLGDQIRVIIFVGDAHGGGQIIGADEDGVHAGNAADGFQVLDTAQRFNHGDEDGVCAAIIFDVIASFLAGPLIVSEDFFQCRSFERAKESGGGHSARVIGLFDIRHDNSVKRVADFGDIIGIAAVCAGETGDAAGCEGVPDGEKFCEVEGIVFAGDNDKVECIFRQKVHDGGRGGVLQERTEDGLTALQFFTQYATCFGNWHGGAPGT